MRGNTISTKRRKVWGWNERGSLSLKRTSTNWLPPCFRRLGHCGIGLCFLSLLETSNTSVHLRTCILDPLVYWSMWTGKSTPMPISFLVRFPARWVRVYEAASMRHALKKCTSGAESASVRLSWPCPVFLEQRKDPAASLAAATPRACCVLSQLSLRGLELDHVLRAAQ